MLETHDHKRLTETWNVMGGKKPVEMTYLELVKKLFNEEIPLSTPVTRRKKDSLGSPIGALKDFYPTTIYEFTEKISPPHTPIKNLRSFRRIEKTSPIFIKFSDSFKVYGGLKSLGAGGLSMKVTTPLASNYFDKNLSLTIPTLGHIHTDPICLSGDILSMNSSGDDFVLNIQFKNFCRKKRIKLNQKIEEHFQSPFY